MKVLGISGSWGERAYNTLLLKNVFEMLPQEAEKELVLAGSYPLYRETGEEPQEIRSLKEKIRSADLVFISTPEHNHSYSASLKSLLDWVSYPLESNPFQWKVVATMSASTGSLGGPRAQEHLWIVLKSLGAILVPGPEVFVVNADKKFDSEGKLTDEASKRYIAQLIDNSIRLAKAISIFARS